MLNTSEIEVNEFIGISCSLELPSLLLDLLFIAAPKKNLIYCGKGFDASISADNLSAIRGWYYQVVV